MKKKLVVCVITAFCLFVSASPWEGAAATAPEGELPGTGRYIATNSFPRNTIVDIVNIETNKSTRVIVAGNLDSPGLLAIVSREAAELIGMRPGSVCRIRMTQPSDPVAYVRFTEGLSSGIPDYDSGDVITEESYGEFVNPATPASGAVPTRDSAVKPPVASPAYTPPDTGYPAYVLEPEWGGARRGAGSARDIVDLPPVYTAQEKKPETTSPVFVDEPEKVTKAEPAAGTETAAAEEVPETLAEAEPAASEEAPEKVAEAEPAAEEEVPETVAEAEPVAEEEVPEIIAEAEPETAEEVPETIAEAEPAKAEVTDESPVKTAESVAELFPEEDYIDDYYSEPDEIVEYDIVPTDNRPPSTIYGIDPSFIIPGISEAAKPETSNKPNDPVITVNDPNFSVPRIYELERGRYYVQLASFDSPESVQNSIRRIDQHYEPKVYKDGDKWYRILLGPLNQGESAAVLARFKSIGYKDAFVRAAK